MNRGGRARFSAMLAFILVLAACRVGAERAAFTVVDSAGVVIATNEGGEPPRWSLSTEPLVVIGDEAAGDTPLFRIYAVALTSDGGVVVGHTGGSEVRMYGPNGVLRWAAGREGDGPGEFRYIFHVAVLARDSVAVVDPRLQRLTVLDPEGGLVGVMQLRLPERGELPKDAWVSSPTPLGATDIHEVPAILDATMVMQGHAGERLNAGVLRVFDIEGRPGPILASPHISSVWESAEPDVPFENIPFNPGLRPAVAGGLVYLAPGDSWRVDVYDPSAGWVRSIRDRHARIAVTAEHLTALPELPRGMRRSDHVPDSLPAVGEIAVDGEGRIYLTAYRVDGADPGEVRVYDAEGHLVGGFALPGGFKLMAVRNGRALGVRTDDMDVETVVVYGLEEASP